MQGSSNATDAAIELNVAIDKGLDAVINGAAASKGWLIQRPISASLSTSIIGAIGNPDEKLLSNRIRQAEHAMCWKPAGSHQKDHLLLVALKCFGKAPDDISLTTGRDLLKVIGMSEEEINAWHTKLKNTTASADEIVGFISGKLGEMQAEPPSKPRGSRR